MRKITLILFIVFLIAGFGMFGCSQSYDIVIRGGEIYDGSGAESYIGDVGIIDGKIVAIGKFRSKAPVNIDARGLYISPGFIDIHNHAFFTLDDEMMKFVGAEIDMNELAVDVLLRNPDNCHFLRNLQF